MAGQVDTHVLLIESPYLGEVHFLLQYQSKSSPKLLPLQTFVHLVVRGSAKVFGEAEQSEAHFPVVLSANVSVGQVGTHSIVLFAPYVPTVHSISHFPVLESPYVLVPFDRVGHIGTQLLVLASAYYPSGQTLTQTCPLA